jgi:hypothetical protein
VFVIDLSRVFSHGRDVGLALRKYKDTRHVPLVFVDGDSEKVATLKRLLPDAVYTSWRGIRGAVKRALTRPPVEPVVPESAMAGYSGTPLPKKLGIKDGTVVGAVGAPKDVAKTLGELPPGAVFHPNVRGTRDVILWFVKSRAAISSRIARMKARDDFKAVWILWPKQASGAKTDLTQQTVREAGLANGLVDYKVCAFDATWSGLCFTRRSAGPRRSQ